MKKARPVPSPGGVIKRNGDNWDATARRVERAITRQLNEFMNAEGLSKTELAKRMRTSRAQLDRLLDPENDSVTLGTLTRAARAVGRNLRMKLV